MRDLYKIITDEMTIIDNQTSLVYQDENRTALIKRFQQDTSFEPTEKAMEELNASLPQGAELQFQTLTSVQVMKRFTEPTELIDSKIESINDAANGGLELNLIIIYDEIFEQSIVKKIECAFDDFVASSTHQ